MGNLIRKLFFLISLPRSGNTLFASIMNQNKELACTANSITLEIIKNLYLIKQTETFKNYTDNKSIDNIINSVYDNYYKDWPQRIIIDRGPVMLSGSPGNLELMKEHFKPGFKCVVLLRDLMEVLASYIQWYSENPDSFVNKLGSNDEEKLFRLMHPEGAIVKEIKSIQNAYNYPDMCHFVRYDDIVINPEKELRKIYTFLDEPYYPHYFKNLNQININGIGYDDTVVGKNMHKVWPGGVKKKYNPYINKIPERIRQKYGHIKI